jgi:disulfide oxidoreductase YuzD
MPNLDLVEVKIVDLPGAGGSCPCSDPTLTPEYGAMLRQKIAELRAALEEAYPEKSRVKYVDLRESPDEKESDSGRLLASGKYPPPLVVVNGVTKFAGSIQVQQIVKEVGDLLR